LTGQTRRRGTLNFLSLHLSASLETLDGDVSGGGLLVGVVPRPLLVDATAGVDADAAAVARDEEEEEAAGVGPPPPVLSCLLL